jgi:hypothetical protein
MSTVKEPGICVYDELTVGRPTLGTTKIVATTTNEHKAVTRFLGCSKQKRWSMVTISASFFDESGIGSSGDIGWCVGT